MTDYIYKYPRLYLNASFAKNNVVSLSKEQTHYLKNVLRKNDGDFLRVFNGVDGEWIARIDGLGKKSGEISTNECIKKQPEIKKRLHLFFSPIKKQRMDMLIEKSVELGVTDLHPILMNRTENRKINTERMTAQVIEAAEQCERMDIPFIYDIEKLSPALSACKNISLFAAIERCAESLPISSCDFTQECGFLIGPEGGFDDMERALIQSCEHIKPISLGETILRTETAAISCLSYARFV